MVRPAPPAATPSRPTPRDPERDPRLIRPSPSAPTLYRFLIAACRGIGRALGLRLRLEGAGHLPRDAAGHPAGGWIALGVPHRTWIDPFVLVTLLPVTPRLVFLGDGRAIYRSRLRRWLFARIGGVVPIWPARGPRAFAAHLEAARTAIDSGAVFALFPEVGPPVPLDRARPFGGGIGYFAIRTGAPIVPLVLGGTHELFLGRRIVLRALPPVTAEALARATAATAPPTSDGAAETAIETVSGAAWAWPPPPGSAAERLAARGVTEALERLVAADVTSCHRLVEPPPGARRPLRRLTTLFR
jgi:1-acyl-sn-glycerol-3-phosphate acyltransferase